MAAGHIPSGRRGTFPVELRTRSTMGARPLPTPEWLKYDKYHGDYPTDPGMRAMQEKHRQDMVRDATARKVLVPSTGLLKGGREGACAAKVDVPKSDFRNFARSTLARTGKV